jgi:6-pyruvoyltetrahydropterin/6-carboxytetrahydropterin synthase
MTTVSATFTFEGAHFLPNVPAGHKCGRMHGHNWTVEIHCRGPVVEPQGWIVDFYDIEKAWTLVYNKLDHRVLNEVTTLDNPTTENIARWIYLQMNSRVPSVFKIVVRETPMFGATYEGGC